MFPTPRLLARPGVCPAAGEPIWADPVMVTAMPTPVEARRCPDQAAAALALLEQGGDAATALDALPARAMSDEALIDALSASQKQIASIEAKQQEFLAEIAKRDPRGEEFLRDEVACAMHLAPAVAEGKLEVAEQLVGPLSDTLDLLRGGHLSYPNARILAHATLACSDQVTAKVQDRVLPRGCRQTAGEFRAAVRRAIARFERQTEAERHAEAYAQRHVIQYPGEDHMADVCLHLAADGAAIVMTAVNTWAAKVDSDDQRTADQRRADAIVDICTAALDMPGLPKQHGARPALNITMAASTLAGLDDQPAQLDGYGPIPASMARRRASDPTATFRRWLVDGEGRILDRTVPNPGACPTASDLTSRRYTPPASLARHVITRDQHCVHPGCRRKAWACELDHRVPWPSGPTSAQNLQPLCKRHHLLKHHGNWTVHRRDDGTYEWTSPTGHTYRYRPPELPAPEPPAEPDDESPPF